MKKLLAILILLLSAGALPAQVTHTFPAEDTNNTFTGNNVFEGYVSTKLIFYTVATLPAPATVFTGLIVVVTDAATQGSCTVGSGTQLGLCRNSGTAWVPLGGGGGGSPSAPVNSVQFNDSGAFGGSANFGWDNSTKKLTVGQAGDFFSVLSGGAIPAAGSGMTADWLTLNPNLFVIAHDFDTFNGLSINMYAGSIGAGGSGNQEQANARWNCASSNGSRCFILTADSLVDASSGQNPSGNKQATGIFLTTEADLDNGQSVGYQATSECTGDPCTTNGVTIQASCSGTNCNSTGGFFDSTCSGSGCTANGLTLYRGDLELGFAADPGTSGQVMTSQGAGIAPHWTSAGSGTIGGTIASTQVAYGASADTIAGDSTFTWDGTGLDIPLLKLTEITIPSGVSSKGLLYADSATHQLKTRLNAGSALFLPTTDGSGVSGHCAQFTSTYEIIDNGTACGGGAGTVTSVGQSFTGGLISVAGSPVTGASTLALTVAGTSGGIPYFSSGTTWASSGALTANRPVIGGGAGAAPTVGTVSGNTTIFGTVSGALTTQHCIKADASGNLVDNGAACNTGTVTSAGTSFTGGLISVAGSPVTTTGTAALTVAGTSGGVPYFSSASTWASSAALTANLPMIGGGAGAAPAVGTRSGNTTKFVTTTGSLTNGNCVSIDASGNFVDFGGLCGGGGGGGTVTNVALAAPTGFTVSGSPVIASGTLTWAMPSGWTTGSVLLGNGSNSAANLAIGAAGTVLSSNGSTASWAATGAGTVTNFSANNITTGTQNFATQGVTNSGTTPALTFTLANAPAHKYFGNNTGGSGAPDYFSLVAADLPSTAVNTVVNDTNVTGSISGQALTLGWTTALSAARGGTSFASYTKGDLLCPSAATTMTKLGVGSNTQILTADSTATCGIKWAASPATIALSTNSVANGSQTALNFTNTAGASGITFSNSVGVESASLASVAGGGNATLQGTLTGFATGDYLCGNSTPIIVNCVAGVVPNTQTGTTYPIVAGDRGKMLFCTEASATMAVSLPQAGTTGFAGNFFFGIRNDGSFACTITPTVSTVNGAASLTLLPGMQANFSSDNSVYKATLSGTITPLTFAKLPSCSSTWEGWSAPVTDSTTVTWGATITGGSTNHVHAYCNATNWTVEGK